MAGRGVRGVSPRSYPHSQKGIVITLEFSLIRIRRIRVEIVEQISRLTAVLGTDMIVIGD